MEVVRTHGGDPAGGPFDQMVLYLDDAAAVGRATDRLRTGGLTPAHRHPYWAANGAAIYRDPDGRDVVFAPWICGRDPDPIDGHPDRSHTLEPWIEWYDCDRRALRGSLSHASDRRRADPRLADRADCSNARRTQLRKSAEEVRRGPGQEIPVDDMVDSLVVERDHSGDRQQCGGREVIGPGEVRVRGVGDGH